MPRIHTVAADGTITSQDKLLGSDGAQNADFVTRNYTVGGITDFIIGGANHGKFITLTTTGNATIGGDVTIAGNITVGDADTDTISFAADVISNIIPDVTNTYDIGSSTKEWKDIHAAGSIKAGSVWLDGTLSEISGVTNIYAQKYFDSNDSTYFLDPSASISLKVKGNIQLGDANAETNAEITSYGDLKLKADSDNDGSYTRGEEIFRSRGGNDGGTWVELNKSQYDLNGAAIAGSAFETIEVGDVIHGLGGGSNYTTVTSATVSSIRGWTDASDNIVQAAIANPPETATKLTLVMNTSISYSNNAYLTILPSGSTFNEGTSRNIKFYSGTTEVGSFDKDSKLTVGGNIAATGTIVANNTDTINGININNSNQEMSGIGEIYAYKFIDAQTGTHYLDPGNSTLSLVTAGKITVGAFTIPKTIGSSGQVLQVPSSGSELEWATSSGTAIPYLINGTNNTNSLSIGYSSWSGGGPQAGDGGAIENVAVGIGAMNGILQGDGNVAVGYNANNGISMGDFNIAIGHKAGASADSSATNLTSGKRNILIGANAGVDGAGTFNAIIIGTHHDIDNGDGIVASSHQTIIGNDETNNAVVKGLRQEVRTSPATDALSDVRGTDANKITLLDSTSAITITLPDSGAAAGSKEIGKTYTFAVKTAATGGDIHKIVCADTTNEKIIGAWNMNQDAGFYSYTAANNSAINMDGTTKGGVQGTIFSLTCIADDLWLINNATIIYSGTAASPFSTT